MKLLVCDVPSKCRFELLRVALENLRADSGIDKIAKYIDEDERHARFLIQNLCILGFALRARNRWIPTKKGLEYLEASSERRGLLLAAAMLDSKLFMSILDEFESIDNAASLSVYEIQEFLTEHVVVSGTGKSISRTTARRRASSVRGWIQWLYQNLPEVE